MRSSMFTLFFSLGVSVTAVHAAENVPAKTSDFLAYCAHRKSICEDYVNGRNLALRQRQAIENTYCSAENYSDARALRDIEQWLKKTPGFGSKATEQSVDAALQAVDSKVSGSRRRLSGVLQ